MKKNIYLTLVLLLLYGCSSSKRKETTIQINKLNWEVEHIGFYSHSEEDVKKQMDIFELIPGPQKFVVEINKYPGETEYIVKMFLNVRLKHSVNLDLDKILSSDVELAKEIANIQFVLLDRNGNRIPVSGKFGTFDCHLIMFNKHDFNTEWFVDYLTFLNSKPGTEFQLFAWWIFNEPQDRCSIGFNNLIKEVKDVVLQIGSSDSSFEKHIGYIKQ